MANERYLLASDMDGTVIPLDDKPERGDQIKLFSQLMKENKNILLSYVTGRHLSLGLEGVKKTGLPTPDVFVCDVGTTIYHFIDGEWLIDNEYRYELKKSWQNHSRTDIAAILEEIDALAPQEDEKQSEFKQSYYLDETDLMDEVVSAAEKLLKERQIRANIVHSIDPLTGVGLIDILPEFAAKDHALRFLQQTLDIPFDNVVYAGDSGNDLMAFISGYNAVVVNNAAEQVKDTVRDHLRQNDSLKKRLFFAEKPYVMGVVEGCRHFGLFP